MTVRAGSEEKISTFTSVSSFGREAGFAGTEGVRAVDHTVSLVSVSTQGPVAAAFVQCCVWRREDRE